MQNQHWDRRSAGFPLCPLVQKEGHRWIGKVGVPELPLSPGAEGSHVLGRAESWPRAALLCRARGKAAPQPWVQGLQNKVVLLLPHGNILHFQRGCGLNQALALLLVNLLAAIHVLL